MNFDSLGLPDSLVAAVKEQGYVTPSPIQAEAIPVVLEGKDIMAAAQTGTGKTAAFALPLLALLENGERPRSNQVRALILTPTRELAAQIHASVLSYMGSSALHTAVVFGGVKINPQMQRLRGGVDILVATPGRLLDLYSQNAINFKQLEFFVLDEADRMLDMGFIHDIKRVIKALPTKRQNLLFSATFSPEIRKLAKGLVNDPVEISVSPRNTTAENVTQSIYTVDKSKKTSVLIRLIKEHKWQQVLVFVRTKHGANRLVKNLEASFIRSAAIHGNKSQGARTKALAEFKEGHIRVLVATDIAARGIDIQQLPQVINFDLPNVSEDYVHRIGRTGRAGNEGEAISLVSSDEFKLLKDIETLIKKVIPRKTLEGFEPRESMPESVLGKAKTKKPKKNKPKRFTQRDGQSRDGQHSNSSNGSQRASGRNSASRNTQGSGNRHANSQNTTKPRTRQ